MPLTNAAHLFRGGGGLPRIACAQQVGTAIPTLEHRADGGLYSLRFCFQMRGVAQQHGRGQDGAERIGNAFAGDVRRGAVYRLI